MLLAKSTRLLNQHESKQSIPGVLAVQTFHHDIYTLTPLMVTGSKGDEQHEYWHISLLSPRRSIQDLRCTGVELQEVCYDL